MLTICFDRRSFKTLCLHGGKLELIHHQVSWTYQLKSLSGYIERLRKALLIPWEGLNKKLFGMRKGELVTLTGGTGLGKSSVTRELNIGSLKILKTT